MVKTPSSIVAWTDSTWDQKPQSQVINDASVIESGRL